jgi:alpha-mannosidase
VPGHRWADLSEPGFGVSLLNDSRYGHAVFGNVMSLSILRGTMSPDATADIGTHRLRYALYPHAGDWRGAQTVREAHCFNRPFVWANGTASDILRRPLACIEPANLIVDTLKPAEDGQGFVVRLYESTGSATKARLEFGIPVRNVHLSNTLEDRLAALGSENNACEFDVGPFQIVTLRVH